MAQVAAAEVHTGLQGVDRWMCSGCTGWVESDGKHLLQALPGVWYEDLEQ